MFDFSGRQPYFEAIQKLLEKNIVYHSMALEACMGGLYDYFSSQNLLTANDPPKNDWLLAGLIHDADFGGDFKPTHPLKTKEALALHNLEISETVHNIVKGHAPDLTGRRPQNKAEWSIFCTDSLTGLIIATTLVYPSKKMVDVKFSSVMKRLLKEPKFAAGTRREEIKMCSNPEGLNLPLEKFVEICFNSMKAIAAEIGL